MHANSSPVHSTQTQPHAQLDAVVRRHLASSYQRPISPRGQAIFAALSPWLATQKGRELILDSGCGTGWSSRQLALQFPDIAVLGADRSGIRLARSGLLDEQSHGSQDNLCLVRINLEDLWPLLLAAGIRPARHLLWYPNPSPKPELLKRRWHAHPLFPTLLALGGELELRSNWRVYIDEFARALEIAGQAVAIDAIDADEAAVTPFERKYRESGQGVWWVRCLLDRVARCAA
jgi:tRNA G46 methylase TrmB